MCAAESFVSRLQAALAFFSTALAFLFPTHINYIVLVYNDSSPRLSRVEICIFKICKDICAN